MLLDIVFAIVLVLAIFKGYQRGLVVGLFSLVSVIIGLAAAVKLSAAVAGHIGEAVKVSEEWLPVIAFAAVFIVVVILIRFGANAIEKAIEVVMLGWLNKLAGIFLYVTIYMIVFSVLLFYADQIKLIQPATIEKSVTYSYVQPLGPKVINGLGTLIPIFKNMFDELSVFFGAVADNISK